MSTIVFDTLPDILKGRQFPDISKFYQFIVEENIVTEYGELHEDEVTSEIKSAYQKSLSENPLLRTNI